MIKTKTKVTDLDYSSIYDINHVMADTIEFYIENILGSRYEKNYPKYYL